MEKLILTNTDCAVATDRMIAFAKPKTNPVGGLGISVYGVPRGGIPVAYLVAKKDPFFVIDDIRDGVDWIVDDIVDSGATRARFKQRHPKALFLALADYLQVTRQPKQWVVFPWEQTLQGKKDTSADDIVVRLLEYIGEDPNREGLKETPARVLKAWKEWTSGYGVEVGPILKTFTDGASDYDEMITLPGMPFYSMCEHHMAPFFGTVSIGYIPNGKIVGLSKFKRVVDVFSKRLQVQERMTQQIAEALLGMDPKPKAVGVVVKARHLCMESRGVECQGQITITNRLHGAMFENSMARAEFLQACR